MPTPRVSARIRRTSPRQGPRAPLHLVERMVVMAIGVVQAYTDRLMRALEPLLRERYGQRQDSTREDAARSLDDVFANVREGEMSKASLERMFHMVDQQAASDLQRVVPVPLSDVLPHAAELQKAWVEKNTSLIRLEERAQKEVRAIVEAPIVEGVRVEEIRERIQERMGVVRSRAELIARDQTLKLYGQVQEERQTEAGIVEYTWSGSLDEREREDHFLLEGTTQRWDDPPVVDTRSGRREHPGGDFQCRCAAIPILPDDLTGADDEPISETRPSVRPGELDEPELSPEEQALSEPLPEAPPEPLSEPEPLPPPPDPVELERQRLAEERAAREAERERLAAEQAAAEAERAARVQRATRPPPPPWRPNTLASLTKGTLAEFQLSGPESAMTRSLALSLDEVGFREFHAKVPGHIQFTDKTAVAPAPEPGGKASDRLQGLESSLDNNVVPDTAPGFYSPELGMVRVSTDPKSYAAAKFELPETVDTTRRDANGVPVGVPGGTRWIASSIVEDAELVAIHEFGHAVHTNDKAEYSKQFSVDARIRKEFGKKKREAVSTYSDENPKEFFAEAFTAYWRYPAGWMARNAPGMLSMVEDVLKLRGMPLRP